MSKIEKEYHYLTVIGESYVVNSKSRVKVRCKCGVEKVVKVNSLKTGHTKSCGCIKSPLTKKRMFKHGHSNEKNTIYYIWVAIKQRCLNKNCKAYKNYGGRGIKICEEWKNSFKTFLDYVGERPFPKASIDRINNSGNYEPGNIKWSTKKEQNNNTRNNTIIIHNGLSLTLSQWADKLGLKYNTLCSRLHRMSIEKALVAGKLKRGKNDRNSNLPNNG